MSMQFINEKVRYIKMREDVIHFNEIEHPFYIQVAGISYCDRTYCIRRPKSPVTCMEYIIEGKGYVNYDKRSFVAEKGDVYILNAGHDHYYYSDGDNPWTKIWFNVCGEFTTQMLNYYKIGNINIFKNCPIEHLFREFHKIAYSDRPLFEIFDECSMVFMKMVHYIAKDFVSYRAPGSLASNLKDLIDNDINFIQSLDAHAKTLYCTKQHAITSFKDVYGITPYQYIITRKVLAAENLLKNTTLSIAHIAESLNFCDSHYFSYFFKQQKGISPLQYRKKKQVKQ